MRIIKNKIFNRRLFILGSIHFIISIIFSHRLYILQIRDKKRYESFSRKNRVRVVNIFPKRGKILDRNAIELALNKIFLDKRKISFNKKLDLEEILSKTKSNDILGSFNKKENIFFYKRYYPFGSICSHILGYTKKEQKTTEIGVSGVEYTYDYILKGKIGKCEYEINSKNHITRKLSELIHEDGKDLQISIDIDLQKKIAKLFYNHKGSVVVINVKNGEILALYNSPSYDNNLFANRISMETWKNLNSTTSLPLVNRALSYQIPPGSIFKIIVTLTGLKDGIIIPEDKFLCKGYMKIGERKFRCMKSKAHGYVSLRDAIVFSCNTYFYNIGKKINIDSLVEMARKFGIGSRLLIKRGIGFKEESSGLLPDKKWRTNNLYSNWYLGDTINLVIGQGYLLTTPLQLAILAARIATGKKVSPHIEVNKNIQNFPNIDIDNNHLNIIRKAMFSVANSKFKNNYKKGFKFVQIAGKTGTPEINSKGKSHKLFIAYAPYNNPNYAISVFIEHGTTPREDIFIANDVLQYIFGK